MTPAGSTHLPQSPVHALQRILAAELAGDRWTIGKLQAGARAAAIGKPCGVARRLERILSVGFIGAGAAAILLAQLVTVLLNERPSSEPLWRLYFEFARPLDIYYQLVRNLIGEPSLLGFAAIVLGVAAGTAAAIHSGTRLLRAIAYHGLLAMTATLFYFTVFPADIAIPISATQSPSIAAIACLSAILSLVQCLQLHREYFADAGVLPRSLLAMKKPASTARQPIGAGEATETMLPASPRKPALLRSPEVKAA